MNYNIDKYQFLNFINNNKGILSIEEISCLANLYKTYELVNKATNGKYYQNKQKIERYENYIYTFNDKVLSNKDRIELELKRITKKNKSNKESSQEQKNEIEKEIKKLNNLKYNDNYTNYIKRKISILHAKLGIENTFLGAAYEAFVELYIQNKNLKNEEFLYNVDLSKEEIQRELKEELTKTLKNEEQIKE